MHPSRRFDALNLCREILEDRAQSLRCVERERKAISDEPIDRVCLGSGLTLLESGADAVKVEVSYFQQHFVADDHPSNLVYGARRADVELNSSYL
jgi:hypothetical protein